MKEFNIIRYCPNAIWFQRNDSLIAAVSLINDAYTYEIYTKYNTFVERAHGIPTLAEAKRIALSKLENNNKLKG